VLPDGPADKAGCIEVRNLVPPRTPWTRHLEAASRPLTSSPNTPGWLDSVSRQRPAPLPPPPPPLRGGGSPRGAAQASDILLSVDDEEVYGQSARPAPAFPPSC
jgi:hypothetical protein